MCFDDQVTPTDAHPTAAPQTLCSPHLQEYEGRNPAAASIDTPTIQLRRDVHTPAIHTQYAVSRRFSQQPARGILHPSAHVLSTCITQDRNSGRRSRAESRHQVSPQAEIRPIRSTRGWVAGQHARGFPMESGAVDLRSHVQYSGGTQKEPNWVRKTSIEKPERIFCTS